MFTSVAEMAALPDCRPTVAGPAVVVPKSAPVATRSRLTVTGGVVSLPPEVLVNCASTWTGASLFRVCVLAQVSVPVCTPAALVVVLTGQVVRVPPEAVVTYWGGICVQPPELPRR